jgi:hypothetical protein
MLMTESDGERILHEEPRFRLLERGGAFVLDVRDTSLSAVEVLSRIQELDVTLRITLKELIRHIAQRGEFVLGAVREPSSSESERLPELLVEDGCMTCLLSLPPGWSDEERLRELLAKEHIVFGVDEDALTEALALSRSGEEVLRKPLARGIPPRNGLDGTVQMFFAPPSGRPDDNPDGRVDFYNLDLVQEIRRDDVVARRVPPTPGMPGRNVQGEIVPQRKGKPARLRFGKGLAWEGDDLRAKLDGRLEWKGDVVSVIPLLIISGDVDYSTGNINFNGPVLVRGTIRDGFSVSAAGDVDIRGSVEKASVESREGRIAVLYGVQGKGEAHLKAHKEVRLRFAQDAFIECETLEVNEYLLRCVVRTERGVLVEGRKGVIASSEIHTAAHVHARNIRSLRYGDTKIEVSGVSRNALYREYKEFQARLETVEDILVSLTAQIRSGSASGKELDQATKERILRYVDMSREYDDLRERVESYRLLFQKLKGDATFGVRGEASPGVNLRLKGYGDLIRDGASALTLFFDPDERRIVALRG